MEVPGGDGVLTSAWLGRALEASPDWPHGRLHVTSTTRIGTEHGLSGRIHRVTAETERGIALSFVVKQESAGAVERELLFRTDRELPDGGIPSLLGAVTDTDTGRGVLLMEDVAPAEQGDVLLGCSPERAEAVVRILARLHGSSLRPSEQHGLERLPRWEPRPMDADRWAGRLARAGDRFPLIVTAEVSDGARDLPARVAATRDRLAAAPASWLHGDAHLDNVLWRADGAAVLLDWCSAAIGPPAVDLTRFLSEGIDETSRAPLVAAYVRELERVGAAAHAAEITNSLGLTLLPLLQSAVAWAGRGDLPHGGRRARVCESWLRSICAWALADNAV